MIEIDLTEELDLKSARDTVQDLMEKLYSHDQLIAYKKLDEVNKHLTSEIEFIEDACEAELNELDPYRRNYYGYRNL